MKKYTSRSALLEKQIKYLLDEICVGWGFCIPSGDVDRISQSRHLEAKEFAAAVLRAEGLDPEYENKWFQEIERKFADRFGNSVSVEGFERR